MNNSGSVKGIVWYDTFPRAAKQMDKIIRQYLQHGYEIILYTNQKDLKVVVFSNGDKWSTKKANENGRGYKCNISYIDKNINENLIRGVISLATMSYPYQAYNYY